MQFVQDSSVPAVQAAAAKAIGRAARKRNKIDIEKKTSFLEPQKKSNAIFRVKYWTRT